MQRQPTLNAASTQPVVNPSPPVPRPLAPSQVSSQYYATGNVPGLPTRPPPGNDSYHMGMQQPYLGSQNPTMISPNPAYNSDNILVGHYPPLSSSSTQYGGPPPAMRANDLQGPGAAYPSQVQYTNGTSQPMANGAMAPLPAQSGHAAHMPAVNMATGYAPSKMSTPAGPPMPNLPTGPLKYSPMPSPPVPGPPMPTTPSGAPVSPGSRYSQAGPPTAFSTAAPGSAGKVNPLMLPNPIGVHETDSARFRDTPFVTSTIGIHCAPLPSTNNARIIDDRNCSPRFMRPTTAVVAVSEDLCNSSRVPFGMVIQPFASIGPLDTPVQLVDFGNAGPIRCSRCRAYINPHVNFLQDGRVYVCNLCSMENDVPDDYYCNLDMTGRRLDLSTRPELLYGSVDFVASKEYVLRPPSQPYIVFAIDASRSAVQTGAFQVYIEALRVFLTSPAIEQYGRVAFFTFSRTIQFYDLRDPMAEPQLLVMSDVQDPFAPLHDLLFFDPIESSEQALGLLPKILAAHLDTRAVESCTGAAVMVAYEAIKRRGGRVVLMQTSLPNHGIGALKSRDIGATAPAIDKINPLLLPQGDFYQKIARQCAVSGVSVTIVATPASYMDIATLGTLVTATNGNILHYSKFAPDTLGRQLVADVTMLLSKSFVFDALLRIRCGNGLQAEEYYGHYAAINANDLQFAAIDADQSFAVTFKYDARLNESMSASFQCATLYTTTEGQRRIRVHNIALPVSNQIPDLFRVAEADTVVSFLAKRAVSQISTVQTPLISSQLIHKTTGMLMGYRKFCAPNTSVGQLILPESLKLVPLYVLGLMKSVAFAPGPSNMDERVSILRRLASLPMELTSCYLYPCLFALHRFPENDEDMPPCIRLRREYIESHGIYLLENGFKAWIWLGEQAEPETVLKLFGVNQLTAINPKIDELPVQSNPVSLRVRKLIDYIKTRRHLERLSLTILRQGIDGADMELQALLTEEPGAGQMSYVDFMCRLHGHVQEAMSSSSGSTFDMSQMLNFLH